MTRYITALVSILIFSISAHAVAPLKKDAPTPQILLAFSNSKAGGVSADSYAAKTLTKQIYILLTQAGFKASAVTLSPNTPINDYIMGLKSNKKFKNHLLLVSEFRSNTRQHGRRSLIKAVASAKLINIKKGNTTAQFRVRETQKSISTTCKGFCEQQAIANMAPTFGLSIATQFINAMGGPQNANQKEDKADGKDGKGTPPKKEKDPKIIQQPTNNDKEKPSLFSLDYSLELHGVTPELFSKLEPILKAYNGYKGHNLVNHTPSKQRYILKYDTDLVMNDLRGKLNRTIIDLGYKSQGLIYGRTLKVIVRK